MDRSNFLRAIQRNPHQALTKARQARTQNELLELANWWQEDGPRLISLGVLEVFFAHLDENNVPHAVISNRRTPTVEKAFLSFRALRKSTKFRSDLSSQSDIIAQAWPGIFKWSAFFYTVDIQRRDADAVAKRTAHDLITGTWYSISLVRGIAPTMAKTKGAVELMTQLLVIDDPPPVDSLSDATMTLASFMPKADIKDFLDRIVAAVDGKAEIVARRCLLQFRTIVNSSALSTAAGMAIVTLIGILTQQPRHPLRYAFLHHNVVPAATKVAGTAARLLSKGHSPALQGVMVSAFGILVACLQATDGFTWVLSAVQSGLLQALVDASIFFERLGPLERDMITWLLGIVLPKYLVYRSIIQAVDSAMRKIDASPSSRWVDDSPAKDMWQYFKTLASERMRIVKKVAATRGGPMIASCDNLKCQKLDYRNNFKKCAACSSSIYCSKECQAIAWKECDHKTECKLTVQARLEGKNHPIRKSDQTFFHLLTVEIISQRIPRLKAIAAEKYPDIPLERLVVRVDYAANEPVYYLQPFDEYKACAAGGSHLVETRKETLISHVEENPSNLILESIIPFGESAQMVVSLGSCDFWNTDDPRSGGMLALEWEQFQPSESEEQPGSETETPMVILPMPNDGCVDGG